MKYTIYIIMILSPFLYERLSYGQEKQSSQLVITKIADSDSLRPLDIMIKPEMLLNIWNEEAIPIELYTEEEKNMQKRINQEAMNDRLATSERIEDNKVECEEITPFTWKWIDFEFVRVDGTLIEISLLRPHWWIKNKEAHIINNKVYLDMPIISEKGWATVKAIRINQLDTRLPPDKLTQVWPPSEFIPYTSEFKYDGNIYYTLKFEGIDLWEVPYFYAFWSIDREAWISAADLKIGEVVKLDNIPDSNVIVASKIKEEKEKKSIPYRNGFYKGDYFMFSIDKTRISDE